MTTAVPKDQTELVECAFLKKCYAYSCPRVEFMELSQTSSERAAFLTLQAKAEVSNTTQQFNRFLSLERIRLSVQTLRRG